MKQLASSFTIELNKKGERKEEDAKMEKIFKNLEKTVQGQKLTLSLTLSLKSHSFSSLSLTNFEVVVTNVEDEVKVNDLSPWRRKGVFCETLQKKGIRKSKKTRSSTVAITRFFLL